MASAEPALRALEADTRYENLIGLATISAASDTPPSSADDGGDAAGGLLDGLSVSSEPRPRQVSSALRRLLEMPLERIGSYEQIAVELQLGTIPAEPAWAAVVRLLEGSC